MVMRVVAVRRMVVRRMVVRSMVVRSMGVRSMAVGRMAVGVVPMRFSLKDGVESFCLLNVLLSCLLGIVVTLDTSQYPFLR
jgi:hypothetical protein